MSLATKPRCDPCDGTGMMDREDAPATVATLLARTLPSRMMNYRCMLPQSPRSS
jgi:hypothetical protein